MSASWKDDYLIFDLPYWVIRSREEGGESLCGSLRFDIGCRKINEGAERYCIKDIMDALEMRCGILIKNLARTHHLSFVETLDMVAHGMYNHSIDITTIETDDEREKRVETRKQINKNFFERFSEKA